MEKVQKMGKIYFQLYFDIKIFVGKDYDAIAANGEQKYNTILSTAMSLVSGDSAT